MTDPRKALQEGIGTALEAVGLTIFADPRAVSSLAYTTFGGGTFIEGPTMNKDTDGVEATHTMVSWADSISTAQNNASTGLDALTDRSAVITVTGWTISLCRPDFGGEPIKDDTKPNEIWWGIPYRVRFWMTK